MRNLAVILLLSLIILQTGGYYFIFSIDLMEARQCATDFIRHYTPESEEVVTLSFPIQDGKIIGPSPVFNNEDEFSYQGRMYDVISTSSTSHTISFKCYSDKPETDLDQNLNNKIASDQNMPQKDKGNSLLKVLLQQYLMTKGLKEHYTMESSFPLYHIIQNSEYSAIYMPICSPPPEFFHT